MPSSLPASIQDGVSSQLQERNFEVFSNAINRVKKLCVNCHYPENALLYNTLVDQHRKEIVTQWNNYRAWKRRMRDLFEETHGPVDPYNTDFEEWLRSRCEGPRWHISFYAIVVDPREYKLTSVSALLHEIEPCPDCIALYNPTRRKSLPSRKLSELLAEVRNTYE